MIVPKNSQLAKPKKTPMNVLSIPQGSYMAANQKGLLSEYLFCLQIKSLSIEGKISKERILSLVAERTGLSDSQIYKKLDKLVKAGFCAKWNGYYRLISYKRLWKAIGLDVTKKLKIFRITPDKPHLLKLKIILAEIQVNRSEQLKQILRKIRKDQFFKSTKSKTGKGYSKENLLTKISEDYSARELEEKRIADEYIIQYEEATRGGSDKVSCNVDTNISQKKLASLLGYKSSAHGYIIQQQLKEAEMVEIEQRRLLLGYMSPEEFKSKGFDSSFYHQPITNLLFKQQTNILHVL